MSPDAPLSPGTEQTSNSLAQTVKHEERAAATTKNRTRYSKDDLAGSFSLYNNLPGGYDTAPYHQATHKSTQKETHSRNMQGKETGTKIATVPGKKSTAGSSKSLSSTQRGPQSTTSSTAKMADRSSRITTVRAMTGRKGEKTSHKSVVKKTGSTLDRGYETLDPSKLTREGQPRSRIGGMAWDVPASPQSQSPHQKQLPRERTEGVGQLPSGVKRKTPRSSLHGDQDNAAISMVPKDTDTIPVSSQQSQSTKRRQAAGEDDVSCPICLEPLQHPKKLDKCGHLFCSDCINDYFHKHGQKKCPSCGMLYGTIRGDQPKGGSMRSEVNRKIQLPGFPGVPTIIITYSFPSGNQEVSLEHRALVSHY